MSGKEAAQAPKRGRREVNMAARASRAFATAAQGLDLSVFLRRALRRSTGHPGGLEQSLVPEDLMTSSKTKASSLF